MTDTLTPPIDHVGLAEKLAKCPPEQPLADLVVRRGWNAMDALNAVLRTEALVRTGPANDTRTALKVSLPGLIANAELSARLFADAVRELTREQ